MTIVYDKLLALKIPEVEHHYGPKDCMLYALGVGLGTGIALVTLMPSAALLSGSPMPYAPPGLVALVLGSAAAVGFFGASLGLLRMSNDALAIRAGN